MASKKSVVATNCFYIIFIPRGLNVLWLHADVLVKFPSIVLINYSHVLHKKIGEANSNQISFFNKMAP